MEEYNKIMEEVASEKGIAFCDIVDAFSKEKEYLFLDKEGDTVHPNPKGHNIIGKAIYNALFSGGLKD